MTPNDARIDPIIDPIFLVFLVFISGCTKCAFDQWSTYAGRVVRYISARQILST